MDKNSLIFQKNYWERDALKKRRSPLHPLIRSYVLPRIDLLKRYLNIDKNTTLLDVGCGNGFFTYYFDQICNAYGVDYSEQMIQANPVKNKAVMNAHDLKFADNSFDIVFANALLHHVDDIDGALREMKRVAKRNVVILDANSNNPLLFLFSLVVKEERKALKFSLSYLRDKISRQGLRVTNSFSCGLLFPNKTPTFLTPLVKWSNFKHPFGTTNFIISEKIDQIIRLEK